MRSTLLALLLLWRAEETLSQERYQLTVTVSDLSTEGKLHNCERCDQHLAQYDACDVEAYVWVSTPKGWHASSQFHGPNDQNWYRGNLASLSLRGFNQLPHTVGVSVLLQDRDLFKSREMIANVHRQQPVAGRGRYTSRLYGGCGTALSLTIELQCLNGFTGPACDCHNQSTHFCDEHGVKHCLGRYYGSDCQFLRTTTLMHSTAVRTTATLQRPTAEAESENRLRTLCNTLRSGGAVNSEEPCGELAGDVPLPTVLNTLVNASAKQWPFIVAVIRKTSTGSSLQCTAALIHSQFLLAFAKCFKIRHALQPNGKSPFYAFIRYNNTERLINIVRILPQAQRNVTKFSDNQLAVLVLEEAVPVPPLCLPLQGEPEQTSEALVTHRWQSITISHARHQLQLAHSAETLYNASQCVSVHSKNEAGQDAIAAAPGDVLCTLKPVDQLVEVNCNRQSGTLISLLNKRWTMLGVLHGSDTCDLDLPEIYHSVAAQTDWISRTIMSYACAAQ